MKLQLWYWTWVVAVVCILWVGGPAQAITLDGYFKVLALAARKRDVWRKIFLGKDVGFDVSPWLFKDRVKPPYVPVVTSFPRWPMQGHYRNERDHSTFAPATSSYTSYDGQLAHPHGRRHFESEGTGGGVGRWWRSIFQGQDRQTRTRRQTTDGEAALLHYYQNWLISQGYDYQSVVNYLAELGLPER